MAWGGLGDVLGCGRKFRDGLGRCGSKDRPVTVGVKTNLSSLSLHAFANYMRPRKALG